MKTAIDTCWLVALAEAIAEELPPPNELWWRDERGKLGLRSVQSRIEAFFLSCTEQAKREGFVPTVLALRAMAVGDEAMKPLAKALGELLSQCKGEQAHLPQLIGFTRWAYIVLSAKKLVAQRYPLSLTIYDPDRPTERYWYAIQRVHYKCIRMEDRGEWTPPIPDGWEFYHQFLHDKEWWFVIRTTRCPDEDEIDEIYEELGWELVVLDDYDFLWL